MYGDYLNMWLLYYIKTMQIYRFTHNPVLLLFVHEPDQLAGRFIANRLINHFFISNDLWKIYITNQITLLKRYVAVCVRDNQLLHVTFVKHNHCQ